MNNNIILLIKSTLIVQIKKWILVHFNSKFKCFRNINNKKGRFSTFFLYNIFLIYNLHILGLMIDNNIFHTIKTNDEP